jgi:hypothetical protein
MGSALIREDEIKGRDRGKIRTRVGKRGGQGPDPIGAGRAENQGEHVRLLSEGLQWVSVIM